MGARQRVVIVCSAVVALSVTLASLVHSEVFAVPSSDNVIHIRLQLPGSSKVVQVRAREGSMVTVRREGEGEDSFMVGFIPRIQHGSENPTQDNTFRFRPFRILELGDLQRPEEEIGGSLTIALGQVGRLRFEDLEIGLKVSGTTVEEFASPSLPDPSGVPVKELQDLYGVLSGETCCVTCGQDTVCANGGVIMSCGSCFGGGGGKIPV